MMNMSILAVDHLGNPYAMNGVEIESREDVINKFKYDFDKDILMKAKKSEARNLIGKRLGCFETT